MKKVLNTKIIGAVLLALIILLIFFSKTIYNANLPLVTAALPKSGKLSKLETSSGIVTYAKSYYVYLPLSGKAQNVLVEKGDIVKRDQALLEMSYDTGEVERKLKELDNQKAKLNLDIRDINYRKSKLDRNVKTVENEVIEPEEVSDYDLQQVQIEISKAEIEYKAAQWDEKSTYSDIMRAKAALDSLYLKRDKLIKDLEKQRIKALKDLVEKENDKQKTLDDYKDDRGSLNVSGQLKKLDINALELAREEYEQLLSEYESNVTINSPCDGILTSVSAKTGESLKEDQLVFEIGDMNALELKCNVSLDNNFVSVGDTCRLTNSSHSFEAVVTDVTPNASNKEVTIEIKEPEAFAGETYDVKFTEESTASFVLVPNGAVNQDNDGYFLYQIKRRDGIMGKEYYVDRLSVYLGDSDTQNTAIIDGISFFDPIVLVSDKSLSAGDTVGVENEEDFFEN